jgi:hypothetical protein
VEGTGFYAAAPTRHPRLMDVGPARARTARSGGRTGLRAQGPTFRRFGFFAVVLERVPIAE